MRNHDLIVLFILLVFSQTCTLTPGLDKYDDYKFGGKNDSDADKDGGKPDASAAQETFWQRYDRLSAEASPGCEEMGEEHLYCTGGVQLEVDLTCPDHCYAVTGRHCFCPYKREYRDAKKICQSRDMHLVKIDDRDENELIGSIMLEMGISSDEEIFGSDGVNGAIWIGLNDLDKEGTFIWPDGSKMTYEPWAHNQPDNLTGPEGEDCVVIQLSGTNEFLWYDYICESYEGMEIGKEFEAMHFFMCENKNSEKKIGNRTVAFTNQNKDRCKKPSPLSPGETCCTTMADVARSVAIEPGRCGGRIASLGSMCTQICQPGKVDYESGCPESILFVGTPKYPPCCTTLGSESAGYRCGLWESTGSSGCLPNPSATTTCPKPTAYKGPDETLVKYQRCGDTECKLDSPQELAWGDPCCTTREDVELLLAVEPGQCGIIFTDWGSTECNQINQKGELDQTCPSYPIVLNSPIPELDTIIRPGCCSEVGVCGAINSASNLGCSAYRADMKEPYQLCRRANKDESIGIDPLLNRINYIYRNDATGVRESRSKDYGNCDGPIEYNRNTYYFCQGPLEWAQARAVCEWKKDRYLVHVDDTEENSFLHERFHHGPFWIGAYVDDISRINSGSVWSDSWLWSDIDQPFFSGQSYQCVSVVESVNWNVIDKSYVNWVGCDNFDEDQAQPNDDQGIEENCAQMRPDGYWSDENCAIQQAYVCEEKD